MAAREELARCAGTQFDPAVVAAFERILPKIELSERPEAADDPAIVERCTTHVRSAMQAAVDDLASKRRFPVLG